MKKTYVKPVVMIEKFTLSTSVAGDCEKPFNLQAQFVCGIPDDYGLNLKIFDTDLGGDCIIDGSGQEVYDGFCYHIPTEKNELFNS